MKILFDTNIFLDVQRGKITQQQVATARQKMASLSAYGCVSPLSLVELGSHICDEEKDKYESYRRAFEAITQLCDLALLDPEMFMRREIFAHPIGEYGLSPEDTLKISQVIAQTRDYDRLADGQVTMWGNILSRVFIKTGYLKQFREKYEMQYVQDMEEHVLAILTPDHKEIREGGGLPNVSDQNLRTKFAWFLESDDFEDVFYRFTAIRVNVCLLGTTLNSEWDRQAKEKLADYCAAYKWILRKIAEAGYNPEKNKNDFNDIHFLVYLADPQLTFVTHDGGIVRKIEKAPHKERIQSFTEWIAK